MPVYDAAMLYKAEGTPLVVLAGAEYGTGSSRDWAAKGTMMLGVKAVLAVTRDRALPGLRPLAVPVVLADGVAIAQTFLICRHLGERCDLVPDDPVARLRCEQLLLTMVDLVSEVHDAHHPLGTGLFYEQQALEAAEASRLFLSQRLPKFFGFLEEALQDNGGEWLAGDGISVADLWLFQIARGLDYAFPTAWTALRARYPGLVALQQRVARRPRVAAFLASERSIPFNTSGIFRHYPELDLLPAEETP